MTKEFPIRTGVGSLSIPGPISCDQEAAGNKAMSSAATSKPPLTGFFPGSDDGNLRRGPQMSTLPPRAVPENSNQAAKIIEPY